MRTKVTFPISALSIVAILAALLAIRGLSGSGAAGVLILPSEDAVRIGVEVKPVAEAGLITRDQALASASARWEEEPARGEAFLQLMTDPETVRAEEPVVDRAVWVVRYSGLTVTSPGDRELHYAYVVIDARTGIEIHTKWAQ